MFGLICNTNHEHLQVQIKLKEITDGKMRSGSRQGSEPSLCYSAKPESYIEDQEGSKAHDRST